MTDLQRPKKIVINNAKKSMMPGIGTPYSNFNIPSQTPPIYHSMANTGQVAESIAIIGSNTHNRSPSKQMTKLNEQVSYYREKNDQNLIKVRFLTQKLETFGALNSLPQTITNEISETDSKIKKLQESLFFRKSKQMKKMKKKIQSFLQLIQFEISQEDIAKLEDEVEIAFFLIDIFSEKYNQMMIEKAEIDLIVEHLKEDVYVNKGQLDDQNRFLRDKNTELTIYIRDLELQIYSFRKQPLGQSRCVSMAQKTEKNFAQNHASYNRFSEDISHNFQIEFDNLSAKLIRNESSIKHYEIEIGNYKRKIQELDTLLKEERVKIKSTEQELLKVQKQEARWKQRFEAMERQKNERIYLLQKQKRILEDMNNSSISYHPKQVAWSDQSAGTRIGILTKKMEFDPKYRMKSQPAEDSEQQYYDVPSM